MESKKNSELSQHKASVKSKLMAAIAMLLVSTIMLASSTFAWFTLSTAPEVTGMSTTVGSNGSLEIALLNDSTDTGAIQSNVGDSSVVQDVTKANITWGNIVDLSSTAYGLSSSSLKLYPAALNLSTTTAGSETLANLYNALKYPLYGVDGRVAELKNDTGAGRYADGSFAADTSHFGVRAVGTFDLADPIAVALTNAKNDYTTSLSAALIEAKASLNTYGTQLTNMAVKYGNNADATYSAAEVANITGAIEGLQKAADNLKEAIQYAYHAFYISVEGEVLNDPLNVDLSEISTAYPATASVITALNTLQTDINAATAAVPNSGTGTDGAYVWTDISASMRYLVDTESLKISGYDFDEVKAAAKAVQEGNATPEQSALVSSLMSGPTVSIAGGLYSEVANFTGGYASNKFDMMINSSLPLSGAVLSAEATVDPLHTADVTVAVAALTYTGTGNEKNVINTTYGYIIDLAVRSSADTNLLLSDAVQRVSGADETMGGGSVFTTTATDVADLAAALRVVFVKNAASGFQILGVAAMNSTPETDGSYALHMYEFSIDTNGGLKLGEPKTDEVITSLTANEAQCISVLVYLDGNYVDYAMDEITGTLNLQFGSSTTLVPMDYSGYVEPTIPVTTAPDEGEAGGNP